MLWVDNSSKFRQFSRYQCGPDTSYDPGCLTLYTFLRSRQLSFNLCVRWEVLKNQTGFLHAFVLPTWNTLSSECCSSKVFANSRSEAYKKVLVLLHKRLVGSSRVRVCRSKTGLLASCTRVLERKTRTKTFLFIVLDRLPTDFARKWEDKTPNPWASPPLVKWDEKAGVTPSLGDQLRLHKINPFDACLSPEDECNIVAFLKWICMSHPFKFQYIQTNFHRGKCYIIFIRWQCIFLALANPAYFHFLTS